MLYLSLFCLNLSYRSLDVYNSGGCVVPNSDVYKYSDPNAVQVSLLVIIVLETKSNYRVTHQFIKKVGLY